MDTHDDYSAAARDVELERNIREELYLGCVDAARDWAAEIHDHDLATSMRRLIREYEAG